VIEHPYREPPDFLSFTVSNIVYYGPRPPLLTVVLERPDGLKVRLYRYSPPAPRPSEQLPYARHVTSPHRVNLGADPGVRAQVAAFLRSEFGLRVSADALRGQVLRLLFGQLDPERPQLEGIEPLPGRYVIEVQASLGDSRDSIGEIKVVRGGEAFGVMGTDSLGRDLAQGLLFGFPVSLIIGVLASTLVTIIGAALGIMSGYLSGKVDLTIQRLADVIINIPGLPLLIFLVFIFGPKLFLVIIPVLVFFGWPGITIVVRSMVLQLREGQLVEAERSIGASRWRIMFRHILPQVAPYLLAQLIFFAPSAILAEATLSFIGLGDPSLPTWGQMLEGAFRTGAVYQGYWWWVVPPGLLIVVTAVTFMLLALSLEPIANPRLRRM
jgi:peptide/nickel transport system permease protein